MLNAKEGKCAAGDGSVSAIVVNYNAGSFLTECVRATLPQVDELWIVDNASTDGSLDMLSRCFQDEPHLKVIRNDKNLGFAVACNIGSSSATGKFLLFLNPDCTMGHDAVAGLLRVLESDPSIGMVGGLLINWDGTEQGGSRRAVPTPWRSFVRAFGLYRFADRWPRLFFDFHLHRQPLPVAPIEVEAISGACMMVKREAVLDVGLWDQGYFLHCEDLDWCMRLRQKQWKILFVPTVRISHALGACSRNRQIFVEWHKHKGMMRFYRKFFRHQYPVGLMGLVAIGVWLRFALVVSYSSARRIGRALGLVRD
jgi:GT2 family glycosyltransferase